MPNSILLNECTKTKDQMRLGEFGIYTMKAFEDFKEQFKGKEEDWILKNIIPYKIEDLKTGAYVIRNPLRAKRPGRAGRSFDVFLNIINGNLENIPEKGLFPGYAIIIGTDREPMGMELDDPLSLEAKCRKLEHRPWVHAFSTINLYSTFIRCIDEGLLNKIMKIPDFLNYNPKENEFLVTLPFGVNLNSFPIDILDDLSDVYDSTLPFILKATQNAIKRVKEGYTKLPIEKSVEDFVTDVFFNIGPLAGGTVPRIHNQVYIRARSKKEKELERLVKLRPQHDVRLSSSFDYVRYKIDENLNWILYQAPFPSVNYEVKLEPKEEKDFLEYNEDELKNFSKMILKYSKTLRDLSAERKTPDMNIIFYATGVVIRPVFPVGGEEQKYNMLVDSSDWEKLKTNFILTPSEEINKRKIELKTNFVPTLSKYDFLNDPDLDYGFRH